MAFNATDFADDTDFERFALDRLGPHRVRVGEPGAIYEPRLGGGAVISVSGGASSGSRGREELRKSLRPLGFAAAYKVLDMLVEHVLRANGGPTGRLTFKHKKQGLSTRPAVLPIPLDGRSDLWDRIAAVYVALQDGRHAVRHRRAQVTANGDLEIYDDGRVLTDAVSTTELHAFAAAVHALAEAVIDGDADSRRCNIVAWHLNQLGSRHGLASLTATDPDAGRTVLRMDLIKLDQGLVRLDLERVRQIIAGQPRGLWDLDLRTGDRVFVGRWEDVPDCEGAEADFHPASPAKVAVGASDIGAT
jgi:hypothetical protein